MEVVGRHALLFDDDATSAFVNSRDALVEWNSLLIDRYDVRHLLQSPPPPHKRRRHSSSSPSNSEEFELDQIRYQDLPPPSDDQSILQENTGAEAADSSSYRAVSFSYGNTDVSIESRESDVRGFLPPFPVPESLLQNLPPTEKLHQIMARTAMFVSANGGQSEIVLRVKQGNNPMFGFLMPDHHLHAYFRFLVDHPIFLKSDDDIKTEECKKADQEQKQTDVAGEALSLLGSVYGSGEDEEGPVQIVSEPTDKKPGDTVNAISSALDHGSEPAVSSATDVAVASKNPHPVNIAKVSFSNKIPSVSSFSYSNALSKKKEGNVLSSLPSPLDKSQASIAPSASVTNHLIVEPPSEMKRMMDKIVEFILKNGKEFEAVVMEQDRTNGRFPFLLPSNQYHAYYLKIIQQAQESKQAGKSSIAHNHDLLGNGSGKRSSLSKESDTSSYGSADLPYDSERKEKFRMVITGSRKDAQDPALKPTQQQSGMSVDAAAAILQAATRGTRNPKLENPMKTKLDDSVPGTGSEGGISSSFGAVSFSPHIHSSTSKPVSKDDSSMLISVDLSKGSGKTSDVSVAKAIAKTAALVAASEADSSEAYLTKEQKVKAERLKRARMFAALIKRGGEPQTTELLPHLSVKPPDSVFSGLAGSGCEMEMKDGSHPVADSSNLSDYAVVDIVGREREGSSVPVDANPSREKYIKMGTEDDLKERRSRKRHHSRSRRLEEEEEEEEEDDYDDDNERNHKHSRKRHHHHHSSHSRKGDHRHRRRHSSSKDKESRHRHKYSSSSEDEQQHRTSRSDKRKVSRSENKYEPEDPSIDNFFHESTTARSSKMASREASLDHINDRWEGSTPLVEAQPTKGTEVSDDLRAKVRAMLLATL